MSYYAILTTAGKAAFAAALANGGAVAITHMRAGDGLGAEYDPTETQTALKRTVWTGSINRIYLDPNNSQWFVVEGWIPSDVGDFTIREVGLYNGAGTLLAIGKYPSTYKPAVTSGAAKDLYIRMILEVANANQVAVSIDPSAIMASQSWVSGQLVEHLGPVHGAAVGALDMAGLANRELLALRQQRMQRGEVTLYNRGIVSGCARGKVGGGRLINMATGVLFMHGHRQPVFGAVTSSEMVPENTGAESATCQAYAERVWDADIAAYRTLLRVTALGGSVPAHGLHLSTLTVPANSTLAADADLSGVTLANAAGLRTEPLWPQAQTSQPYVNITPPYPYPAADYQVRLDAVSWQGPRPVLNAQNLATNTFRAYLAGDADAVTLRWQIIRP